MAGFMVNMINIEIKETIEGIEIKIKGSIIEIRIEIIMIKKIDKDQNQSHHQRMFNRSLNKAYLQKINLVI